MTRDVPEFFAGLRAWAKGDPGEEHAYGPHPEQYAVLRGSGERVALVIHGGFWRAEFTLANTSAVAVALARAGWTTWNLEYRRIGAGGGYPQTLDDVRAACAAFTPDVAVGHSTGGQLALWAAAEGVAPAAVALAGVCDLEAAAAAGLPVTEFLHADADPVRRAPLGAPSLLVHGTVDDNVPLAQSETFRDAAGGECRLVELDGADHFDVIDPRAEWWPEIEGEVDALVS